MINLNCLCTKYLLKQKCRSAGIKSSSWAATIFVHNSRKSIISRHTTTSEQIVEQRLNSTTYLRHLRQNKKWFSTYCVSGSERWWLLKDGKWMRQALTEHQLNPLRNVLGHSKERRESRWSLVLNWGERDETRDQWNSHTTHRTK